MSGRRGGSREEGGRLVGQGGVVYIKDNAHLERSQIDFTVNEKEINYSIIKIKYIKKILAPFYSSNWRAYDDLKKIESLR